MPALNAVDVSSLTHHYGPRQALDGVTFRVELGEIFALLGPNGGGKTTLFRILSTLVPPQAGSAQICGFSVGSQLDEVRRSIGVVFQAPSLDKKLTVDENIAAQASLYGLRGRELRTRRNEMLEQLGITDRRSDFVEHLSGGLRRRVDLAKSLIHRPPVLLLDEPSVGLDPGARSDLWRYLRNLREQFGTTIVVTSHLLEEADRADCIGILHNGRIVAKGNPATLRASIGGNSVTVETDSPASLCRRINEGWQCDAMVVDGDIRVASDRAAAWATQWVEQFPDEVKSVRIGRPTLEDVFIEKTGHRFWQGSSERDPASPRRRR